jgi:hypothetical protein
MSVPTPTGVLQGVAAFNWDGAVWQPAGRAGPSVATPTGNLQGVAAFTGGPSWAPTGRAGPGVATPTGVLDGVAVYTWSGSQWTPPGGTETVPTPTGGLRGIAAFDWDGTAWQPAGQARPSVPTPYGVLDGVARFNWTGTAWAAVGAPSFQRDFTSGSLGAGAVFTRASTGTYYDSAGVLRTAAINAPRFDYDPATLQLKGLLLEDTSTNLAQQSANLANAAAWGPSGGNGVVAPTATGNQVIAPDGTTTAARIVFPAVSGAGAWSTLTQNITTTVNPSVFSMWLRGNVGGELVYLQATPDAVTYYRSAATLTTAWQRFSVTITGAGQGYFCQIGIDRRDAAQTSTSAQTIFAWGAQCESNYMSSHIPTTTVAVARAIDVLSYPIASVPGFDATKGSLAHEYILEGIANAASAFSSSVAFVGATPNTDYIIPNQSDATGTPTTPRVNAAASSLGGTVSYCLLPVTSAAAGQIHKSAAGWSVGSVMHAAFDGVGDTSNSGNVTALPVITNLSIAGAAHGQSVVGQWSRRVTYWPRQLSPSELVSVTS